MELKRQVIEKHLHEAVPSIPIGAVVHLVAAGQWNNFDLVEHLAGFAPGADLWLATWGISDPGVRAVHRMLERGSIRSVSAIVDTHTAVQHSGATAFLKSIAVRMAVYPCHAKAYVLRSDSRGLTLVCSANLTSNPRLEAGVMCCSETAADFHIDWIRRVIDGAPPFVEHDDQK